MTKEPARPSSREEIAELLGGLTLDGTIARLCEELDGPCRALLEERGIRVRDVDRRGRPPAVKLEFAGSPTAKELREAERTAKAIYRSRGPAKLWKKLQQLGVVNVRMFRSVSPFRAVKYPIFEGSDGARVDAAAHADRAVGAAAAILEDLAVVRASMAAGKTEDALFVAMRVRRNEAALAAIVLGPDAKTIRAARSKGGRRPREPRRGHIARLSRGGGESSIRRIRARRHSPSTSCWPTSLNARLIGSESSAAR